MHIITRKRLNEFAEKFPEIESALSHWYKTAKSNDFDNFAELRELFSTVDQVGKLTVFNIGGNKVRLIAAIHYNRKRVYIRAILTHAEYDKSKWKE
jgi:mRNA interferase HigB